MKMLKFHYKAGLYPTTMQGFINEFIPEIFERNKQMFLNRFNLEKDPYEQNRIDPSNMTLVYMANFSAYIIYDKNTNKIYDLAFENLFDFVWILQVLNIDNVEFEIPETVYNDVKKDFKLLSDRIILDSNE